MIIGEVEALLRGNTIEIFQSYGNIRQKLRSYEIPINTCKICGSPDGVPNCHRGFKISNELVPSKLIFAGYYQKKTPDKLTEDVWVVRKATGAYYNIQAQILMATAQIIISNSPENYTHILNVPSRLNKKLLLKTIVAKISENLKIVNLEPNSFFTHDNKLHNEIHIRRIPSFEKRKELIRKLFSPVKNPPSDLSNAKIILIDDLVQTGITMNRLGSILKNYGAHIIHGFSWLRAWEDKFLMQ